jgi:hypothetical protein
MRRRREHAYKSKRDLDHLIDGLRKAELPE